MQGISNIIAIFGTKYRDLALAIDEAPDNVRKWVKNERIPDTAWPALIVAAKARGRQLTFEEILNANRPQKKRPGRPPNRVVRLRRKRAEARAS